MIYIKEDGKVKKITLTNKNIDKMHKKPLFWIQNLINGNFVVNKWNEEKGCWIPISDLYVRYGNALRFLKRY